MTFLSDSFAGSAFLVLGSPLNAPANPNPTTLVNTPDAETIVPGCDLTVTGTSVNLTWDLQGSQNLSGSSKQVTWRVRRDNLTGTVLASIARNGTTDSSLGNDPGVTWVSNFTDASPTTGHYVLTVEGTGVAVTPVWMSRSFFTATGSLPSTAGFTTEAGEPLTMPIAATAWAKFQPAISGVYQVDTIGSSFDTGLAVYSGSTLGALTLLASDNNSGPSSTSVVTPHLTGGVTYMVQVGSGSGTAAGTLALTVTTLGYDMVLPDPVYLLETYGSVTAGLLKGRSTAASDALPGA